MLGCGDCNRPEHGNAYAPCARMALGLAGRSRGQRIANTQRTTPMRKDHVYVLGINAYDHDVSACLLRDGAIAFAISKERITREKHDTGFHQEVVDYCLSGEGISLDDVDLVVRNCYVLPVEDLETR